MESGDGRRLPECGEAHHLIGVGAEDVGGAGGTPLRQDVDELEIGEGEDNREEGSDQQDRADRRQGHGAETLEGVGPIERRCLMKLRGDSLQTGEDGDGEERESAPDVGDADGADSVPSIAEEVDVRLNDAPALEHPGDGAEHAVEQHQPGETADGCRDDEWQQQTGPNEPAEVERLVQYQGKAESQEELEGHCHEAIDQRVGHCAVEDLIS